MKKTFVGPRLRQLRQQRDQTQKQMARALGVSAAYVNMLENNQRSLSVQVLIALEEAYGVDWRSLVSDEGSAQLAELRSATQDPLFAARKPGIQELRAAIDHAPTLVENFLQIYRSHRTTLDRMMRAATLQQPENLIASSPETIIHDFFRDHRNHFETLERAAERIRREEPCSPDEVYVALKRRLTDKHKIAVLIQSVDDMPRTLRAYERDNRRLLLSEALDHQNRTFQLAHMLCLVEFGDELDRLTDDSGITSDPGLGRCQIELANYFAAAFLMPYRDFQATAERTRYDIDRLAAAFGVSFEQACHRLTTLQRPGAEGVPFFFLRVDKAGNVTKRFNSTTFTLAEYGGACPVWNIHTSFRTPGVILPQFVELPDGERFFTLSRTADRPVFSVDTQDRRLALALGCSVEHADRIGYASQYNIEEKRVYSMIGINCHLCTRTACAQRAHQPLVMDLPIDTDRRGDTRYES